MPVVHCGEGLSSSWKTKKDALKWYKEVSPCEGPCPESDDYCYPVASIYRDYSPRAKRYLWFAQVFCVCVHGPEVPLGQGAVVAWAQVPPARKQSSARPK